MANSPLIAQTKAESSSKPNTPSSIEFSPLTIFSQSHGPLFGHSPTTDSPRKMEAEVDDMPKNNSQANAGSAVKKIKKKTKGVSDLSLRNSFSSMTKTKTNTPNSNAWSKPSKLANIVTDSTRQCNPPSSRKLSPNLNITPAKSPKEKKLQKCVVCDVPNLGRGDRRDHFTGEPHKQVRGLLEVHGQFAERGEAAMRDAAQSANAFRAFGDGCYCHVCGSPFFRQNNDNMRKHLGKGSHLDKLKEKWAIFVQNARSVAGLRAHEVPRDYERTFF
jgi:stalled ribosome alternative rescue factor ArfA